MFIVLFHAAVVALDGFSLWYDQMYVDIPLPAIKYVEMPFKGRLMFLTIWCLVSVRITKSRGGLDRVGGDSVTV